MCYSKAGRDIILQIPLNKILPETDAPFTEKNGMAYMPWDTEVIDFLAVQYGQSIIEIKNQMENNLLEIHNTRQYLEESQRTCEINSSTESETLTNSIFERALK